MFNDHLERLQFGMWSSENIIMLCLKSKKETNETDKEVEIDKLIGTPKVEIVSKVKLGIMVQSRIGHNGPKWN